MTYLLIAAGLALLFVGGEVLVRGAVGIARSLNVSELVIGAVLVGFGTSMPELVTTLRAIETDAVGVAVGNVVGSNIANILLVLGAAALLSPILTNPGAIARDTAFMVGATAALCALIWFDAFTRPAGLAFLGLLAFYIVSSLLLDAGSEAEPARMHREEAEVVPVNQSIFVSIPLALAGVAGVLFGARFLVDGAIQAATALGVSATVIGLTIVAVGTSLPELATSLVAALRGKSDVALGNVLGSNIFNALGIMGVAAVVNPFSVFQARTPTPEAGYGPDEMVSIVTWEEIGALILSVFLLILFALTGRRIARWEGLVLLAGYALYLGMVFDLLPALA